MTQDLKVLQKILRGIMLFLVEFSLPGVQSHRKLLSHKHIQFSVDTESEAALLT